MSAALPLPCDETAGRVDRRSDAGGSRQSATLVATVMASSLAYVVGAIINVALPAMQEEFGVGASSAQWIVNVYLLPLGAFVLLGGALGDHYGRRRAFLWGLAVFLAGSLSCALAPSFRLLLVARAVQGIGGALVAPISLAIIAASFSGAARGKAVGTWAAAGAIAGAFAPVAGGWIVDQASWRWAFGAIVPLAGRVVPESYAEEGGDAPLDWLGAGLMVSCLLALIWTVIAARERAWSDPAMLASGIGGIALLGAFLVTEHRKSKRAMVPLAIFARPTFSGITLVTLCLYMAMGGLLVVLPYMLIQSLGWSATAAGAAILPFPVIMGLLSVRAPLRASRQPCGGDVRVRDSPIER